MKMKKSISLPHGELFINEVKKENSIAITDNPDEKEIQEYFAMWKSAKTIIYVVNKEVKKIYTR
jgi:hypothetical protein